MVEDRVHRRMAAILAADIVGYIQLVEADEAAKIARLKSFQPEPNTQLDLLHEISMLGSGTPRHLSLCAAIRREASRSSSGPHVVRSR